MKVYRPNHIFYAILLIISIVFIFATGLMPENNKWFSVVTGIGSGGIASVTVAWLIDISSCKRRNRLNQDLLKQLFRDFDTTIDFNLEWILKDCALRHPEIDRDHKYSIAEIKKLVENEDGSLPKWVTHYHNFGVAFNSVDASVLLAYDPSSQHTKLYAELVQTQNFHNTLAAISSKRKWEVQDTTDTLEYSMLCFEMDTVERIYSIRSENKEFEVKMWGEEKDGR